MLIRLFEAITGRPWTTTHSCTVEFGPPPGTRYATDLAAYSDAELYAHGESILAALRARDTAGSPTRDPATARR